MDWMAQLNATRAPFQPKEPRRDSGACVHTCLCGAVFHHPPFFTSLSLSTATTHSLLFFFFFFVFLQYWASLMQDATSDELWKYWRFVARRQFIPSPPLAVLPRIMDCRFYWRGWGKLILLLWNSFNSFENVFIMVQRTLIARNFRMISNLFSNPCAGNQPSMDWLNF